MQKTPLFVLVFLLSIVGLTLAANCGGEIPCQCGDTVVESFTFTYNMTANGTCAGNGLTIGADDVTLECVWLDEFNNLQFSTIGGSGTGYGIYLNGKRGFVLDNCFVSGFQDGVHIENAIDNTVQYTTIQNNARAAVYLKDSSSEVPMGLSACANNSNANYLLGNNYLRNGQYGVYIENSSYNCIMIGNYTNNHYGGTEAVNAYEDQNSNGNYWTSSSGSTRWSDFAQNPGYPYVYYISGPGNGVNYRPYGRIANSPPDLAPVGDRSVDENQQITIELQELLHAPLDNLTFYTNAGSVLPGVPVLTRTGTYTAEFTWTTSYYDAGTYPVTFGVMDQGLMYDEETITITVNNVNRPPVFGYMPDVTVNEGQAAVITAVATDPDNDPLTYGINDPRFSQNGNVFTWNTGYNDAGVYEVQVSVTDNTDTVYENITVTVLNVNMPPTGGNVTYDPVYEGQVSTIIVHAYDGDGDPLTYGINDTRFTGNGNVFTWQTGYNDAGVYPVRLNVSDGQYTIYTTIDVTVWNVNRPPVFGYMPDVTVSEGQIARIFGNATDPDNDPLTYGINDTRFGQNGSVFTWNTGYNDAGVYEVQVSVSDNTDTVYENITVTVLNVNQAPNAPSNPVPANGARNVTLNSTLSWTGSDPDGDTLRYDVYFGTNSSNLPLVAANLTSPSYVSSTTNYKTYYWRIVAKDNGGLTATGPIWNFTAIGLSYIPGDANGFQGTNGNDVTFLVRYFKGGAAPPLYVDTPSGRFYPAGDANGDCKNNGNDVTFLVAFFKGIHPRVLYCSDYPPS